MNIKDCLLCTTLLIAILVLTIITVALICVLSLILAAMLGCIFNIDLGWALFILAELVGIVVVLWLTFR